MSTFTAIGTKVSIGAVKTPVAGTDLTATDFTTGATWKELGELRTMGAVGDTWDVTEINLLSVQRTQKVKTNLKAGSAELVMNADYANEGQLALRAAAGATGSYAFKVEFADKPAAGAAPKNSVRYFCALVTSVTDEVEDSITVVKATLEINSNIVIVHASAT